MQYKLTDRQVRFFRFIIILLGVLLLFRVIDFSLSEIADIKAYEDAEAVSEEQWNTVFSKLSSNENLTDEEYELIFSQTGLGRPALDALTEKSDFDAVKEYREYYLEDKEFKCIREGVFACHEHITDSDGNLIYNPPFADIQNGDIILTLSIHSLGWRHGHAAVVTDAEKGITAEAVMMGYKSDFSSTEEWRSYPLVAVLRAKNRDASVRNEIARFTKDNLIGLEYSLLARIVGGNDTDNIPVSTHCAHLVRYAYKEYGIDIDSDGGVIVTPYDILHSGELEIVQIYGNIKEL